MGSEKLTAIVLPTALQVQSVIPTLAIVESEFVGQASQLPDLAARFLFSSAHALHVGELFIIPMGSIHPTWWPRCRCDFWRCAGTELDPPPPWYAALAPGAGSVKAGGGLRSGNASLLVGEVTRGDLKFAWILERKINCTLGALFEPM